MSDYGYGLWALVAVDSLLVIVFAVSFFHPHGRRDWRALGGFAAFVVALFSEMYGYPLTIYLLSGVLGSKLGLGHGQGHLWNDLIGWHGDPHLSPFHIASYLLIIAGFWLIAAAWRVLLAAQRDGELATSGPYAHIRHPQYSGLLLIMVGFLVQWPTIPTLLMFPVLVLAYRRLACREERDTYAQFGEAWKQYAMSTPRFVPAIRATRRHSVPSTDPSGGGAPFAGHPSAHSLRREMQATDRTLTPREEPR
jgi:protein-S-isoprenylcysteine O-methyltransferase Ste14